MRAASSCCPTERTILKGFDDLNIFVGNKHEDIRVHF